MTIEATRPIWNDAMLEELANYTGLLINKWCNDETDLEQCIEDSKSILKYNYNSNGYELAKEFDDKGYSPDPQLVEELDMIAHEFYDIKRRHINQWVARNNIVLSLKEGAIVKVKILKTPVEGEIVKLYPESAQYGVWVESEGRPKGTSHYLINSEDIL